MGLLILTLKNSRRLDTAPVTDENANDFWFKSPESMNPYKEAAALKQTLEEERTALQKALNEYQEAETMPEYNISPAIWNRLYKARMKKALKEMEQKTIGHQLNRATNFLQVLVLLV